jgi:hypothetical protein
MHLDLKKRAGNPQARHLDRCDRRRGRGEARRSYLAVVGKPAHVGEIRADIDYTGEAAAWAASIAAILSIMTSA